MTDFGGGGQGMNQQQESEGVLPNFHTHTLLCQHARGMPVDYVKEALKARCSALGFSDHCPYPSEDADRLWAGIRMSESQIPLYTEGVREAKEAAQNAGAGIPVYLGFECEWDRDMYSWFKDDLLGAAGADYLALGAHWVILENGEHLYIADVTDSASTLRLYIDQTIEGMASGVYKFVAHPDIFMQGWREWDDEAKSCSSALLDAAEDLGLPLEVNGYGLIKPQFETSRGLRYHYPYAEFWQLVAERGLPVICNSDAHDPEYVIENAAKAKEFALACGVKKENIVKDIFR